MSTQTDILNNQQYKQRLSVCINANKLCQTIRVMTVISSKLNSPAAVRIYTVSQKTIPLTCRHNLANVERFLKLFHR